MSRLPQVATALLLGVGLLAGCAPQADYSARFLRYEILADGTRVAVVDPVPAGSDPEQRAFTSLGDLQPGDMVDIRWIGKDWDAPQTVPEREIVSRTQ